jgi:hypothetical protein
VWESDVAVQYDGKTAETRMRITKRNKEIFPFIPTKKSGYKNAKTTGMAIAAIFDPMSYSESICGVVIKI